jgi:hypothetical protein
VKDLVKPKSAAARDNVAVISDPITTKVCNIPDLAKKELSNILAKSVVAEKEKAAEEKTSQIVPEDSTPSTAEGMQQIRKGNDMGEGVPNTRTDAAVLSTSGIRHAVDTPHGASGEPPNKKKRRPRTNLRKLVLVSSMWSTPTVRLFRT